MAVTFVIDPYRPVRVPEEATASIDAFRDWAGSDDLPETIQLCYHRGEVWLDMGKQQIFSHVAVKMEISRVLAGLAKAGRLGLYLMDGVLLTSEPADLSVNPDGVYVSNAALEDGRLTLVEGREGGFVELLGSVDMVLEVVSDSSEKKDSETLFEAYYEAGIQEYWLVDARRDEIEFHIYTRGPKRFRDTRRLTGWVKSGVFGKPFRLTREAAVAGRPEFTLEVK